MLIDIAGNDIFNSWKREHFLLSHHAQDEIGIIQILLGSNPALFRLEDHQAIASQAAAECEDDTGWVFAQNNTIYLFPFLTKY